MDFEIKRKWIGELFTQAKHRKRLPPRVVDRFFSVLALLQAAPDESELRKWKQLHYEKLKGARGLKGERSLRLTEGFCLVVKPERSSKGTKMLILDIKDYHRG
jgi:proteic killer suppression protein